MPDSPLSNDDTQEVLSQIANEEIDRMIAEAQDQVGSDPPAAEPITASSSEPTPSISSSVVAEEANLELNQQLDDLFDALNEASADVPPPPENLAKKFVTAPPPEPAPAPALVEKTVESTVEQTAQEFQLPQTPQLELQLPAAEPLPQPEEKLSLSQQVIAAALNTETEQPAQTETSPSAPSVLPKPKRRKFKIPLPLGFLRIGLKPFFAISDAFSEKALDWMGKIAILTTVNALLLLVYVAIFRKHQ